MEEKPSDEAVALFVLEVTRQQDAEKCSSESQPTLLSEDDVVQLQTQLAYIDLFDDKSSGDYLKALLLDRKHTKVRMRPERNHRRPHFHIEYKREHSASYAVDTLERLAGYMPRKYEKPVLEWAERRQRSLAATWTSLLAGEDVRELVLVAPEAR